MGADGGAPAVLALLVCSGPDIKGDRGGGILFSTVCVF